MFTNKNNISTSWFYVHCLPYCRGYVFMPNLSSYVLICMIRKTRKVFNHVIKQNSTHYINQKQFWRYLLNILQHIYMPLAFQQPRPCPFQIFRCFVRKFESISTMLEIVLELLVYISEKLSDFLDSVQNIWNSPRYFHTWF